MRTAPFLMFWAVAAGCAMYPAGQHLQPVSFTERPSEAMYAPYMQKGGTVVTGQAFLMTRGGDAKKAAGREVTLDPATPYAEQWFAQRGTVLGMFDWYPVYPTDSLGLFPKARHSTVADADGKFEFDSIPAGRYIIRSTVTWEAPDPIWGTLTTQGGVVAAHISVPAQGRINVILNATP